jgi:NodT family efflux transporter outer membrane factor (OMF) lipoprotein
MTIPLVLLIFGDPVLEGLVERAQRANLDVKIAESRLREARALQRVSAADLLPSVGHTDTVSRLRLAPPNPPRPLETNLFQVGFDARWELDVFGGVRRSVDAARAGVRAAGEDLQDIRLTLVAEVARNYLEFRGRQARLAIARRNAQSQRDTVELIRIRQKAGLASDLDVERAASQAATTEATVPSFDAAIALSLHRLAVLLGEQPSSLRLPDSPFPNLPVPLGDLPSDLLTRRPDLRRAEAELAAAEARLGVARAERMPKFSLTGLAGRQATAFDGLTLGAANLFSIGPSVRLPIFTGGRIRANITANEERYLQAKLRYQAAALAAFEDANGALVAQARERERLTRLTEAVMSARRAVELAQELYLHGLADFLSVLEAQRSLYDVEDQLAASEQSMGVQLVALFKSLGGVWP